MERVLGTRKIIRAILLWKSLMKDTFLERAIGHSIIILFMFVRILSCVSSPPHFVQFSSIPFFESVISTFNFLKKLTNATDYFDMANLTFEYQLIRALSV